MIKIDQPFQTIHKNMQASIHELKFIMKNSANHHSKQNIQYLTDMLKQIY